MKRFAFLFLVVLLTLLTQIGGLVLIFVWLVARLTIPKTLAGWQRALAVTVLFLGLYQVISATVVPALAALGGRAPLPCYADKDRPFAAANRLYCWLNRHYVDPRIVPLLTELSREIERAYPGTITLYLDANFPFIDGFPLVPHLSHNDGRKLDLAFYYAAPDGSYLPGGLRSPIGYWAFEHPGSQETPSCPRTTWLTLRWNLDWLQSLYPVRPLEPKRTAAALRWLAGAGKKFGVQRVFVEPYLASRLGVSSPLLGFQGCRAARHDDHIHFQISPLSVAADSASQ